MKLKIGISDTDLKDLRLKDCFEHTWNIRSIIPARLRKSTINPLNSGFPSPNFVSTIMLAAGYLLMTAGLTFSLAGTPAPDVKPAMDGIDSEIVAKAEKNGSMLTVLMIDIDKDEPAELQRKLQILKTVQKEIGEENLLRLEIIEELKKTQYALQMFGLRPSQDHREKDQKLSALEKIGKIIAASAKETEDSRKAKDSLNAFRSALAVFHADKSGFFPVNPEELVDKYLPRIPYIKLPGHPTGNNSVQILTGIKSTEELFQKVGDSGGWFYVGDKASPIWGTVIFDCNHRDYNGTAMYRY
ncbi:MAG: hypothetical protein A2270_01635 [Elusimicrobia bacterium RIFOXYA12_FULL_51_18]|nr:MAG: hypothetical protein A2270_01635 [Elusimicrobia bacterium RIFOXYA12_FULL_51_18]OGS29596.1 MAG: hypothetical protein A2218_01160 [Elusimicrobia bacterium RIFOXYA2_FULL_53_38]